MRLTVYVVPAPEDVAAARDGIEDLSFDAATGVAEIVGIDIASDDFIRLYQDITSGYKKASEYLLYFMHMAIAALRIQLESGLLTIVVPVADGIINEQKVRDVVLAAAKPIAACLLHTAALGDKTFIPDAELLSTDNGLIELGIEFDIECTHHQTFKENNNDNL